MSTLIPLEVLKLKINLRLIFQACFELAGLYFCFAFRQNNSSVRDCLVYAAWMCVEQRPRMNRLKPRPSRISHSGSALVTTDSNLSGPIRPLCPITFGRSNERRSKWSYFLYCLPFPHIGCINYKAHMYTYTVCGHKTRAHR